MSRFHAKLHRARWERVRLEALDRDNWRCRKCGRAARMEVDHIRPMHLFPGQDPYDVGGLQSLCKRCHRDKTRNETERRDPARDRWRSLVADRLDPD